MLQFMIAMVFLHCTMP